MTAPPLPTDTILDRRDPADGKPLIGPALDVMKVLYLRSAIGCALRDEDGWSDTQIVDQLERMRRDGIIRIRVDERSWTIEPTPKGEVEHWLQKHGAIGSR